MKDYFMKARMQGKKDAEKKFLPPDAVKSLEKKDVVGWKEQARPPVKLGR